MEVTEQLYRIRSKNWSDYQKLIEHLNQESNVRLNRIARAAWGLEIELRDRHKPKDGWEMESVLPHYEAGTREFLIHVKLRKKTGYSVDSSYYRDNDDIGIGGYSDPPEQFRNYQYERATVVVDNNFIMEHKL